MEFPDSPRVVYERNPLKEVVCQFRFPRILALDEQVPAEFQGKLGQGYPLVEARDLIELTLAAPGQSHAAAAPPSRIYEFSTADAECKIALSSSFLAITTPHYRSWEAFREHVSTALDVFRHIYSPPIFTRIGLRYQNVVCRDNLGLAAVRWGDLIRPSILGLLGSGEIDEAGITQLQSTVQLLQPTGQVTCRFALLKQEERSTPDFLIDCDFFSSAQINGASNVFELLSGFNVAAGRAFRWFITNRLHESLGPRTLA